MDLKKVVPFSGILAGLAFLYFALWGLQRAFWQKLFLGIQMSMGIDSELEIAWEQGLLSLGLALVIGSLALYFLGKNWAKARYLGIFALYLILVLFITSWLISQTIN